MVFPPSLRSTLPKREGKVNAPVFLILSRGFSKRLTERPRSDPFSRKGRISQGLRPMKAYQQLFSVDSAPWLEGRFVCRQYGGAKRQSPGHAQPLPAGKPDELSVDEKHGSSFVRPGGHFFNETPAGVRFRPSPDKKTARSPTGRTGCSKIQEDIRNTGQGA